jgi:cytochrome P450
MNSQSTGVAVTSTKGVQDIKFADPAFLADPWPELVRLQREAPVYWSEDRQGWIISRHEDVKAAYADRRFSAARVGQFFRGLTPDVEEQLTDIRKYYTINVSRMDGPDHLRIRVLMLKAFNKAAIKKIEGFIGELIDQILDRCEREHDFEFGEVVGSVLPTMVIQKLLGLPDDAHGPLYKLALDVATAVAAASPTPELMLRMEQSIRTMNDVFNDLVHHREANPGDDLISTLVHARDGLNRLSHDELLACFHAIIVAGTETTSHSLGVGLVQLARNAALQKRLRAEPRCAFAMATELLRYPGTVKCRTRIAAEEFELHGQKIHQGDLIWIMNAGANVDARVFSDPFIINPDRDNRESMAFGPGLHFCVGHYLAGTELSQFFARAFARCDVRILQDDLQMVPSYVFYGYKTLPVRFTRLNN